MLDLRGVMIVVRLGEGGDRMRSGSEGQNEKIWGGRVCLRSGGKNFACR